VFQIINFASFFFLYPSVFNLKEVAAVDVPQVHLWVPRTLSLFAIHELSLSRCPASASLGILCMNIYGVCNIYCVCNNGVYAIMVCLSSLGILCTNIHCVCNIYSVCNICSIYMYRNDVGVM